MKIGVNLSSVRAHEIAAAGRLAEESGFDAIYLGEHIAVPVELSVPYPGKVGYNAMTYAHELFVALGYLAAVTKTVRLGTGICILPIRHPLQTARSIATVDRLSGGRLDLAVGTGSIVDEFEVMQSDYASRGQRLTEIIEIFDRLWREETPSYQGKHYRFREIGFEPKPLQRPRPPLYVGAISAPGFKRAAQLADGWYGAVYDPGHAKEVIATLNGHLKEAGRDPAGFKYGLVHAMGEPILPTQEQLRTYEEIGVETVVISPFGLDGKDALATIAVSAQALQLKPRNT